MSNPNGPSPAEIAAAAPLAEERIRPYVRETPLQRASSLDRGKLRAHFKLENHQLTGSFKIRGAMHKLLCLTPEQRQRGIVAASSGNHGVAVATGLRALGCQGTIFVPHGASPAKVDAIRRLGADVRFEGEESGATELVARAEAVSTGREYLSPYNDPDVVAGQATVGVELARQLPEIDTVYIAAGGGGLLAGIGSYLRSVRPGVELVACSPERSATLHHSLQAGHVVDSPTHDTLSDGTAGGIEPEAITIDLCCRLVDRSLLVSEEEIAAAMRLVIGEHHLLVEGAAGVAVAAYLKDDARRRDGNAVILLCGANLSLETLRSVLA